MGFSGTRIMKSKFCGNNFNFKLVELLNAEYEKYKNIDLIKAKLVLDILYRLASFTKMEVNDFF